MHKLSKLKSLKMDGEPKGDEHLILESAAVEHLSDILEALLQFVSFFIVYML